MKTETIKIGNEEISFPTFAEFVSSAIKVDAHKRVSAFLKLMTTYYTNYNSEYPDHHSWLLEAVEQETSFSIHALDCEWDEMNINGSAGLPTILSQSLLRTELLKLGWPVEKVTHDEVVFNFRPHKIEA